MVGRISSKRPRRRLCPLRGRLHLSRFGVGSREHQVRQLLESLRYKHANVHECNTYIHIFDAIVLDKPAMTVTGNLGNSLAGVPLCGSHLPCFSTLNQTGFLSWPAPSWPPLSLELRMRLCSSLEARAASERWSVLLQASRGCYFMLSRRLRLASYKTELKFISHLAPQRIARRLQRN